MTKPWHALAVLLMAAACATEPPAPPGSREEAVNREWQRFCAAGYCEGFAGTITERTDTVLTVNINGNTRFIAYTASGGPGAWRVQMRPGPGGGRLRPA